MSPGRRITRSTLQVERPQSTNDATDENTEGHTIRSYVVVQQTSRTTRDTIHTTQVRFWANSTAHTEQHRTSTEDNIFSSQARSLVIFWQLKFVEINVEQNVPHKPHKATRGLGTSKIAKAASSGKLSVNFDADCLQPICANAERFNNEIGFVVRNHGTFHYKDWRLVPEAVRARLRHYLLENFDINLSAMTTIKCTDDQMRKAWRNHKFKLHSHFKSIRGENDVEMAKRKRHTDLKDDQQSDWEMLCDRWCTNNFKERAIKNTENNSKRRWAYKNGSVSTTHHHIRHGMVMTSLTGQIETWRRNHFDKNGWTGPDLEKLYDQMVALRNEHSPEELFDKDIMERVLGRHSMYLRGLGRSVRGTTRNLTHEHAVDQNLPSYQEILQQINEANNHVREGFDILRCNNLMPPPSTPSTNEASATNSENQDDL